MWKKVAEICAPYGLNGLQLEIIPRADGKAGYLDVLENMLEGFRLAGNGFKAMVFLSPQKYKDKNNAEIFRKAFQELSPLLRNHPNAYRLDGAPVVPVYIPYTFTPEEWHSIISEVEGACGRMVWLADIRNTYVRNDAPEGFAQWLKSYMQVFDGITIYANWSLERQRDFVNEVVPMMKKDFPGKIFEFGPHNTYCPHFAYEGMSPRLTEKFVKSWDMTLEAKPDSITITNFFDHYENSRILPSYEMDDILMRMSEYYISRWKKTSPPETQLLALYVANYINVTIGSEALFEVIGFPFEAKSKTISVRLEICDGKGNILHAFPEDVMTLDSLRILQYSLPTLPYATCRALFPRLKYTVNGKEAVASSCPPTTLVANLRPHLLMWCRSVGNMIDINGSGRTWTLNGAHVGETAAYPHGGIAVINCDTTSAKGPLPSQGGGAARLLRNGREIDSFNSGDLSFNRIFRLPDPCDTIDCYNLELENNKGGRYLSPAIWVSRDSRKSTCVMPTLLRDNKIMNVEIEAGRVPFFYYPCDQDCGTLLVDCSGYDHHGFLGGCGFGGGHLQRTAYRHEHLDGTGAALSERAPKFNKDEDGTGFLHFWGGSYAIIMGGTAFPYSSTYELSVRPGELGKRQGLIGTFNGQMNVELTPEGKICAWRSSRVAGDGAAKEVRQEIFSKEKVEPGKWHRVAVVYDLKTLSLFIDGQFQGEVASAPDRRHEWMNPVTVGALCAQAWSPSDFFIGDIRDVRIYGRNLDPVEFLKF